MIHKVLILDFIWFPNEIACRGLGRGLGDRGAWEGGVLSYMGYIGMCLCEVYGFSSSLLWHKLYKSESLGLEEVIIFHLN